MSYAGGMEATREGKTYNEHFESAARRAPDRIALRLKTAASYRSISYGQLLRDVKGTALALAALGLQPRARAAILSENRPEWIVSYLGILFAGGIVVPLDPQISPEEWRRLLDDSESQFVFVSGALLPKLREAVRDSPLLDRLICFDPAVAGDAECRKLQPLVDWGHDLNPAPKLPVSSLSDTVAILYTSGTTGTPKGVMLSQANVVSNINASLQAIRVISDTDVFLCLLPLQHIFASVVSFLLPLSLGAEVVFADTLKRAEILEVMQEGGITILATVPQFFYLFHGRIQEELAHKGHLARRIYQGMLRINRFCLRRLHFNPGKLCFGTIHRTFGSRMRLFVSGGSAFEPAVAQEFHDLGFTILQGYGLTETTGPCAVTRIEDLAIGSVGPALPGVEIRIMESGEDGIGEVGIRGPIVMQGYYRNPQGTAATMRDGWFLSGDLGRLDERGRLYITGRKKEVIVLPSGKNIYPDELEAHYARCPYVKEIAVIGIADPDRRGDERLHALVVPDFDALKAKRIANTREILRDEIARLSSQLPSYKRLMSYQIRTEELPRTTTRKIKRLELKHKIESGELRDAAASSQSPVTAEDDLIMESAVGQEVISCLTDRYGRRPPIRPDMNLELDLGFDSMERVELFSSMEQALGFALPDSLAVEVYTVRDLILVLQQHSGSSAAGEGADRQSWSAMLAPESLAREDDLKHRFAGTSQAVIKYVFVKAVSLVFRLLLRFEAEGLENLPPEGPFLICPNHLSYLDGLLVLAPLPHAIVKRVFFLGAAEFFAGSLMKMVARVADIFSVDPDLHLLQAMKVGALGLRSGRILCIFPEGARSFDGELGPFKKGAAILAREIAVPVIPVAIHGAFEVWPRGSWRIHLHRVRIVFGKPWLAGPHAGDPTYEGDTTRLRDEVLGLLQNP